MQIYLLDTNIISEPSKPMPNKNVLQKIADNLEYSCISSVTWAETLSGIKTMPDGKRKTSLFDYFVESVQKQFDILPFDANAANIYSDLYERLKAKGTPAQRFDLLIAAIAISNNLILVTRNVSDFKDIAANSNLMIENWFEE